MIRAKFRCLSTTYTFKGEAVADLKPVIAKTDSWTGGSTENTLFWSASPSGECEVRYRSVAEFPFEVGSYYYVDFEPLPEGTEHTDELPIWKLYEVGHRGETQMMLWFDKGWADRPMRSGMLKLTIENRGAWPAFEGKANSRWSVTFTKAPADNSGCPYTG